MKKRVVDFIVPSLDVIECVECLGPVNLLTKTSTQLFSSNFCELFKNTFFYRTPLFVASGSIMTK